MAQRQPSAAKIPRLPVVAGHVLGRRLTALMDEQGLTSYALAQATHLSEAHVALLRRGEIDKPRPATVNRLATSLGVPIEALLSDHPGEIRVTVSVPDDLADVLHALAAVQRTSTDSVVGHEVLDYLRRRQTDSAIVDVVAAIKAARISDQRAATGKTGSQG